MTARPPIKLTLVALAAAAAAGGCGSSEGSGGDPAADRKAATEALINKEDLPLVITYSPPSSKEPCSPVSILRREGAQIAESEEYYLESTTVREAVGVFPDSDEAEAAYDALDEDERRKCIRRAVHAMGSPQNSETILPLESFDIADEDSFGRVLGEESAVGNDPEFRDHIDSLSIRSGRCLASVTFVHRLSTPEEAKVRKVGENAGQRLEDACD
jgi:hypothetical protein